jgi:hypothetical protein
LIQVKRGTISVSHKDLGAASDGAQVLLGDIKSNVVTLPP